jgi:hypothetical protein
MNRLPEGIANETESRYLNYSSIARANYLAAHRIDAKHNVSIHYGALG